MQHKALEILSAYRVMAIATLRSDGWPQVTLVGYAHDELSLYFMISRRSQKFENIARDDRVSVAIGSDFNEVREIRALSIAAHVSEVTDANNRETRYKQLVERHPRLAELGAPDYTKAALMRATPKIVTILDYTKGFGHVDTITVGLSGLTEMQPERPDDWGFAPSGVRQGQYFR